MPMSPEEIINAALPTDAAARIREERIVNLAASGHQLILDSGVADISPDQAAYCAVQIQAIANEIERLQSL